MAANADGEFDPHKANEVMRLSSGSYFGERALLLSEPRAASVIVSSPKLKCLCISRSGFESVIGSLAAVIARHSHKIQARSLGKARMKNLRAAEYGIESPLNLQSMKPRADLHLDHDYERLVLMDVQDVSIPCAVKSYDISKAEIQQKEKAVIKESLLLLISALDDREFMPTQADMQKIILSSKLSESVEESNKKEVQVKEDVQDAYPFVPRVLDTIIGENTLNVVLGATLCGSLHDICFSSVEPKVAAFVCACVATAIPSLHAKQILCRGISKFNLYVDKNGYIRMCQFSSGKFLEDENDKTYTMVGDESYMAPEQVLNKGHGLAVDYWALGVLCMELLLGHSPFLKALGGGDMSSQTSSKSSAGANHGSSLSKGKGSRSSAAHTPLFQEVIDFNKNKLKDYEMIPDDAKAFLSLLLERSPKKRWENSKEVLKHPFLRNHVDLDAVRMGTFTSPLHEVAMENLNMIMGEGSDISMDMNRDPAKQVSSDAWFKNF